MLTTFYFSALLYTVNKVVEKCVQKMFKKPTAPLAPTKHVTKPLETELVKFGPISMLFGLISKPLNINIVDIKKKYRS